MGGKGGGGILSDVPSALPLLFACESYRNHSSEYLQSTNGLQKSHLPRFQCQLGGWLVSALIEPLPDASHEPFSTPHLLFDCHRHHHLGIT